MKSKLYIMKLLSIKFLFIHWIHRLKKFYSPVHCSLLCKTTNTSSASRSSVPTCKWKLCWCSVLEAKVCIVGSIYSFLWSCRKNYLVYFKTCSYCVCVISMVNIYIWYAIYHEIVLLASRCAFVALFHERYRPIAMIFFIGV